MRRKIWTSVIWIISCLGASDNFQKVIAIDDVNDLSRTSEAKRISDSSGDSTTIREELGSRKRSRVILLGSGSGSSPREGSHQKNAIQTIDQSLTVCLNRLTRPLITNQAKKAKMISADTTPHECYLETLENFESWESYFLKLRLEPAQRPMFRNQMKAVKKSLLNLFEPKVDEFSQRRLEMSLSSIADISKTWETLNPQNKPESLIIKRGSDLMIGCFVDLKRLGILPQESLSNFLNRDNRGKLIASYIKSRYPTLTLTTAYLNFNLKLSLIHSSYTKQMAKLLEGLDRETWERIEFDCLQARMTSYQLTDSSSYHSFASLQESFLKVASPENVELHETELIAFLESLINHVTSQSRIKSLRPQESQKLIHLKHLYDMLSFITRYRRSFISDKFLEQNKQPIRVFEEAVGLMSNIMHLIIIRKNAYYEELKAGGTLPSEIQKVSQDL
ncbi:uncharacterized protein PGTG_13301 [Puccinia graminis f. sp. tritici CRL 75-36-700-3]|uniref:Uncharacterized protein n=1 Tax=Puccinia graminis f. sp. tritici (strain CRL 75-36-700-3 / race SCCL) TaxID=418459 RepID=E3KS07_PUCGT|nr:uncharacterized protein PGTG_13301 [Puccinia graminis f. sp. tritici CRL 75-36-700-3]EFP87082.2 hypothetical protein PGTG_13301 [Puccinia graminis f. sp. tritici CRL 75-36-700-3]